MKIAKQKKYAFRLAQLSLITLAFCGGGILMQPLHADDLQWAEEAVSPKEEAPEGFRNNISLETTSALDGLFELRFQHYFRDSIAYYIQLQLGSSQASSLKFLDVFNEVSYTPTQVGFELGMSGLLYARNSKITKDIRRWGTGLIWGFGFRTLFSNISGGITDNILSFGITNNLGWQQQSGKFSISVYLEFRILLHISTDNAVDASFPVIQDKTRAGQFIPPILFLNNTEASALSPGAYYSFSQRIYIRLSYYF